ncbi:protein croquemort-like [Wyeomyia smithii]|uniref:protein croquemort-like n=1 Tax=Wyeomyia smithii TaxID=174621 RepID=UPI00246801D9|nr:protein croquemort-like [Wyeomyia smithii]XP_055549780.1 protein croquemort-like [Wyeomyia smithii]
MGCCCNCSNFAKKVWSFSGVLVIFGLAAFFGFGLPAIVETVARKEFIMEPGTQVYENWLSSEVPKYLDIYFWDWVNPDDITNRNIRPKFEEKGPYVFLEDHERHDIEFNTDHTISFRQKRTWTYIPEQSRGDFYKDTITTPQTILMTLGRALETADATIVKTIDTIILKNDLLDAGITYKDVLVRDILFDGVHDELLIALQTLAALLPDLGFQVPPWEGFAYFTGRNTSVEYDGLFRIGSGTNDWTDSGLLKTWNGLTRVPFFRDSCGTVHGSTGQVNPPLTSEQISNPEDFTLFITDVCSAFNLKFSEDIEYGGVDGRVWIGDNRIFDNGHNFPETKCQCTAPTEQCPTLKSGVLDISDCKSGAPLLASFPHFYLADSSYQDALDGLDATREKHEFQYIMHPFSGIPLEVNGRLQYNIHIKDYGLNVTDGLPDILLPVFWVNQRVVLTQDKIDDLKVIDTVRSVGIYTGFALLGVGIVALGIALYYSIFVWKK